jgi:uncharacterized protein YjbI with pentapeptide repeats
MLVESSEFSPGLGLPESWGDTVFRYCTFDALDIDGINFDGLMDSCTIRRSTFYWGLFNTALLHCVRFEHCIFPGTSFRGCSFVDCAFSDCAFILDNLGGSCTVDGCLIAATHFTGCRFEHRESRANSIFTRNRVMGSTHVGCTGIAPLLATRGR